MPETNFSTDNFLQRYTKSGSNSIKLEKALNVLSQFRNSSSKHPAGIDVAAILLEFNVDQETLLAALLSDPSCTEHLDPQTIAAEFGACIAELVKDITWLNTQKVYTQEIFSQPNQAETLRRMLLSMTHDVRAVLVKLAYRLQRLRMLAHEDYDTRRLIARETLDIYAPIANRLGIGQLKWELEDLAFRYLEPQIYRKIAQSLADSRNQREDSISQFIALLQKNLSNDNIKAEIAGRPKHIYSIWNKMRRKQLDIDELYDLLAVRVIVDQVSSCYAVLGIVHGHWQYIPKEFDDYIANPKENGYQSLHTVIIEPQGNRIEVQIRTRGMHDFAELGVAAHWRYKEGGRYDAAIEKNITSLRLLLDTKDNDADFVASFHTELFYDRVYVLTPNGKLLDLPKGSTPLDFAYAVHTEIGHRCRGAKVNGRIVPLTYTLQSGEQVEIMTGKESAPKRNWIDPHHGYLKSSRAIQKIKAWFKQQQFESNVASGKQMLEKIHQQLGLDFNGLEKLAKHFKQASIDKMFAAIGRGDISSKQIASALHIPEIEQAPQKSRKTVERQDTGITVAGLENIQTHFAQCCKPVPGDSIIGLITQNKGITVHRRECANLDTLDAQQQTRLIDVSWGQQTPKLAATILISAYNKQGLINDVTQIFNAAKIDILNARFRTRDDMSATLEIEVLIQNTSQLSQIISRVGQLPNIIDIQRKT